MIVRNLTGHQVEKYKKKIVDFIKRHGDKRITREAIQWVRQTNAAQVAQDGTVLMCALDQNKVVGVLIAVDYGMMESFIVVHRQYRNQHVAKQMVKEVVSSMGKIYGRVAMDNAPSLKVCLDNDMVAFHLFEGPTGKPTLWLGGGNWSKEDVL
ncbi:GNAT family N-acetyltransferase [Caldalkalibacillus salinus]|uniref:GNAT family N-acetyltransferase n=1 Tax=Caldalkalibacillus salinus TaxID=2803787 RepID=UPI001920C682|nr:GNAT family N-acetyltransferase [Caldalkalibacillus salinus]